MYVFDILQREGSREREREREKEMERQKEGGYIQQWNHKFGH